MTYEQIRAELALEYGWTFDDIDDMPFDMISSACRHGKPKKGVPVSSHEDVVALSRKVRKALLGK